MFYKSCLIALARDRYSESALARIRKTERERKREVYVRLATAATNLERL